MLSEVEALSHILDATRPLPSSDVPLLEAVGYFAARDLFATVALPGFDQSSMDGYALRSADPSPLRVVGEQAAGENRNLSIGPGETIRIFTGAPMPRGADAVLMQEDAERINDTMQIKEPVEAGENVRRAGGDLAPGQKLISRGEEITPQMVGLLASQGLMSIAAGTAPRIRIVSTGTELRAAGSPLEAGTMYESNGPLLAALSQRWGAHVEGLAIAPDEHAALAEQIAWGLEADVLVISGGVSVGDHDLVKPVLSELGVDLNLWRVALRPGKPFAFGTKNQTLVFGLPGNPVSAFVTFLIFGRPALRKLAGASSFENPTIPLVTTQDISNPGDRPHYLRGKKDGDRFIPVGLQESHALYGLSRSDALARIEAKSSLPAGSWLSALIW